MKTGVKAALIATPFLVLLSALASGFVGLMAWGLALNGYMGQERAVSTSLATYLILAVVVALVSVILSFFAVRYFAVKREWHLAGSALLAIVVFSGLAMGGHLISVVISAVVAEQMRTKR